MHPMKELKACFNWIRSDSNLDPAKCQFASRARRQLIYPDNYRYVGVHHFLADNVYS